MNVLKSYKNGKIALIVLEDAKVEPFVVVSNLNEKEGNWSSGSYFRNYDDAEYVYGTKVINDEYENCTNNDDRYDFISKRMEKEIEVQKKKSWFEGSDGGLLYLGQLVYARNEVERFLENNEDISDEMFEFFANRYPLGDLISRVDHAYEDLDNAFYEELDYMAEEE